MKKDGIPPRRTGCSVVQLSPATWEVRVRFPASASKKILFKLLSFALLAHRTLKFDISLNLSFYPTGLFVYWGDSCYVTD